MSILELQVEALVRLCAAENESERLQAKEDLRKITDRKRMRQVSSDPEYLIRELLLDLGAPEHLVGHPYVVQAVLLAVDNRNYIDNITTQLYPKLAAVFETTPARTERAIRHLIEVTWSRGNMDILSCYFGNTVSSFRGKPTNSEFLARLTNLVILRIQEAA